VTIWTLKCPIPLFNAVHSRRLRASETKHEFRLTLTHYPPVWATCFEPKVAAYSATIDKHNIHLLIPSQGRPECNKDGTIKNQGKLSTTEMKIQF
jgi:hypothetical protein